MDVVEFLDTISEMCKEGAKTKYYKNNKKGTKLQGERINWDILNVYKNFFSDFTKGMGDGKIYDIYGYHRDTIGHHVKDKDLYPSDEGFNLSLFNEDVKIALLGYLHSIKDTFYSDDSKYKMRKTPGWYVVGNYQVSKTPDPNKLSEDFDEYFGANTRLIIGYRGLREIKSGLTAVRDNASFDLHFSHEDRMVYYNVNHKESFRGQVSFDPVFQIGMNFMNWRGVPF
jgi:hypothetical protein